MHRRERVRVFRVRLAEALQQSGLNRSKLAGLAGIDRSTLSQLLLEQNERLPRADTVAAIASVLQVSTDWLLGLTADTQAGATIGAELLEIAEGTSGLVDENLARWYQEATGYKIRHVPGNLPDLVKTDAVLSFEYGRDVARSSTQAMAASRGQLEYTRLPETDVEVCMPMQTIDGFARGQGIWQGLERSKRRQQLARMATLCEELYPGFRLYLFDARNCYSAPYTVFGPLRAALFVGQIYFVFNTHEHVAVLTRHFDHLVRAAVVNAHEAGGFLRTALQDIQA